MKNNVRKLYKFLYPIAACALLYLLIFGIREIFGIISKFYDDYDGYVWTALYILLIGLVFVAYLSTASFWYSELYLRKEDMKLLPKILLALYNALIISLFFYFIIASVIGKSSISKLFIHTFSSLQIVERFCKYFFVPGIVWCAIWSLPNIFEKINFAKKFLTPLTVGGAFNLICAIFMGLIVNSPLTLIGIILCILVFSFLYSRIVLTKGKFGILFATVAPLMTLAGIIITQKLILKWYTYIFSSYIIPKYLNIPILVLSALFSLIGVFIPLLKKKKREREDTEESTLQNAEKDE